ncbi:hypothetical protein ACHWQZ_G011774 [Mnemiopsis leidyi]
MSGRFDVDKYRRQATGWCGDKKIYFSGVMEGLMNAIDANRIHVLKYEKAEFQKKVYQILPLKSLKEATLKSGQSKGLTFHENFIKEVTRWFKEEFFKWVDCKPCAVCGSPSQSGPPLQPTPEDLSAGATRVENHICTICGASQRFPRYNSPSKLLETREGRCGEWANCFTGICRALGYDARYVYDTTDHVWTEIFSPHLDRWVHVDPCENAWDRPLIYEQGWKKKLSYVIAFSKDEVVDVTYRYTLDPNEIKPRRINEAAVQNKIANCNKFSFRHSAEKKQLLTKRLAKEMTAILLKPGVGASEEYGGRESGSLAWRQSRGEGGTTSHDPEGDRVIRTGEVERSFAVRYSPAADKYYISRDGGAEQVMSSFRSLAYKNENMFRKVEYDWNKVYLARNSHEKSSITWRVECNKPIKSAKITMLHSTFKQGKVAWTCDLDEETSSFQTQFADIDLSKLRGATAFSISAKMSSPGSQNNAWQHTQLFRTDLGGDETPFEIQLSF